MRSRFVRAIAVLFATLSLGGLACDLSTFGLAPAAKPTVTILTPAAGAQLNEGEEVQIQSLSTDPSGIVRVELAVDGAIVAIDVPPIPKGQTIYSLVQRWKATPGTHTLSVRAYNASGVAGDPALLSVVVAPALAQPSPVPTQIVLPPIGAPSPTVPIGSASPTLPGVSASPTTASQPTALQATLTRAPTRPPASPTISAPPGVYATAIRTDPKEPKRNQTVKFFVTFLNTTVTTQFYRWRVRVFPPDNMRNSKGDTAPVDTTLPLGLSEFASADNWTIRGPGDCEPYFARVFWVDLGSRQETEFLKPDGSGGPGASFQICP